MPSITEDIFYGATQSPPSIMCFGDSLKSGNVPAPTPFRLDLTRKGKRTSKTTKREWENMDQWIKEYIGESCEAEKERYIGELKEKMEYHPNTPIGWKGPYLLKFTRKHVKGEDGAIKFQDFEEAVDAANDIEECGGITLTTTGYSLRKGKKAEYGAWGDMDEDRETYYGTKWDGMATLNQQIMCWIKE
tara:strand:- start:266 stop:832 length:567 start_codon:yes stop_codon:yes gene_type:complete